MRKAENKFFGPLSFSTAKKAHNETTKFLNQSHKAKMAKYWRTGVWFVAGLQKKAKKFEEQKRFLQKYF